MGKSKYFWEYMRPVLARPVSSTFDKKRITPNLEFSPGTVKLLLRTVKLLFFYWSRPRIRYRDMK